MDAYRTALREEIGPYGKRLDELHAEIAAFAVRREALEHALVLYERTVRANDGAPRRLSPQTAFVLDAIRKSGAGLTPPRSTER